MLKFAYPFQTKETIKPLLCAKGEATEIIPHLSMSGYDAIELLVRKPDESGLSDVTKWITKNNMQVASFGTGPMVADDQLSFTAMDVSVRGEAVKRTIQLIDWAKEVNGSVSIGKLRGQIVEGHEKQCWDFMRESFLKVLEIADKKNVPLLIEPQNKVHMNNLNGTLETLLFIEEFNSSSLGIMLDNLHMEAEPTELSTTTLLNKAKEKLGFFHITDSERFIPGEGTFNLQEVLITLNQLPTPPIISFEVKQQDNYMMTAKKALNYAQSLLKK